MKHIEYSTIDKSKWGDGPWQNEPDKVQYVDERTGLPCLAVRHNVYGHWCGYVGVSNGHPLFEVECDDSTLGLDVYGSVTYTAKCEQSSEKFDVESEGICHLVEDGEDDDVWWIGFDCAYAGNISEQYKNLDFIKSECASLAKQLLEMT